MYLRTLQQSVTKINSKIKKNVERYLTYLAQLLKYCENSNENSIINIITNESYNTFSNFWSTSIRCTFEMEKLFIYFSNLSVSLEDICILATHFIQSIFEKLIHLLATTFFIYIFISIRCPMRNLHHTNIFLFASRRLLRLYTISLNKGGTIILKK